MDIEDILEEKFNIDFKKVDEFLIQEMNIYAGKFLVKRIEEVFKNKQKSKQWYFSKIRSLGDKRPYDLCKERERTQKSRKNIKINRIWNILMIKI